jgi:hypothetical protein
MKQLHKFYSKAGVPWVYLVWSIYGDNIPHAKYQGEDHFGGGTSLA